MTALARPNLANDLRAKLRIPVMAGPMFIASTADLVIARRRADLACFASPFLAANEANTQPKFKRMIIDPGRTSTFSFIL